MMVMSGAPIYSQSNHTYSANKSKGELAKSRFPGITSIKEGVSCVRQWRPGNEIEAAYPDIDFTGFLPVTIAVMEEDIEEYFPIHYFSINKNGKRLYIDKLRNRSSMDSIQFAGVKGVYLVTWNGNRPVKFVLAPNAQDIYDEGRTDAGHPRIGFEWFTVSYDPDGLPLALDGMLTQKFGGDFYSEIYSDYEFDQFGNWIRRIVTQRFGAGSDARKVKVNEYRFCYNDF